MWIEIKLMFTAIACFMYLITSIFLVDLLIGILLFIGIFFMILGDILIAFKIYDNHLNVPLDPQKPGEETCILFDFAGNVDFVRVRKGPENTREFVKYKKEANIINEGDYQIRFLNGNHGFVGHEGYDMNVNLEEAEALDNLEGEDVKEVYTNLKEKGKNVTVQK